MKAYSKQMSFVFMLLALLLSLTAGINISRAKAFSAELVGYLFPVDCRVEYRGGEVIERAAVTFSGDRVIIASSSLSETADINDVVLTELDDSQRVQNAARVFMLFTLIMLLAFLFSISLLYMSFSLRTAALACSDPRASGSCHVSHKKAAEAGPATAAA